MSSKSSDRELLGVLRTRFESNMSRHAGLKWADVEARLSPEKLSVLAQMEESGGEPDVVNLRTQSSERGTVLFVDCSAESPKGRRSLCFDRASWESRKEHKPSGSAMEMAAAMGVELLTEDEYRALQELGEFDVKTSSWVATPERIRKLGGAIFCDRRYDTVFTYHNGAESYYASRGFRGRLVVSRES